MRDRTGNPFLVITTAIPIDAKHHLTPKVERIVQQNNFLVKNKEMFAGLTKREKQILKFMAPGSNSGEIAEALHHQVTKQKRDARLRGPFHHSQGLIISLLRKYSNDSIISGGCSVVISYRYTVYVSTGGHISDPGGTRRRSEHFISCWSRHFGP
jgi:hypothetical protein